MSKYLRDYSFNKLVVNLIGYPDDIANATNDIISILQKKDLTHKVVSIRPTTLASHNTNEMPKWRFTIEEEMQTNCNVIINKIGLVNTDEITDLNRSIVALNYNRRPIALFVESNTKSKEEYFNSSIKNRSPYDYSNESPQITSIFPLNATDEKKMYEFEIFLDSRSVKIEE